MKKIIIIFALFAITLGLATGVYAQNYKVIVNTDNPVKELTKKQLNKIFLKKMTKWEDDSKIKPVNLNQDSDVRFLSFCYQSAPPGPETYESTNPSLAFCICTGSFSRKLILKVVPLPGSL